MSLRAGAGIAFALGVCALAETAGAVESCKVKVDKKTGVIEFSGAKVEGDLRWGDSSTNPVYSFWDPACVKNGKATKCTLADPDSYESKIPPRYCTLYVIDAVDGCIAWIPGCTPGVRDAGVSAGTIGTNEIMDGSILGADLALGAVSGDRIANNSIGAGKIGFAAVDSGAIVAGAVGEDHIAERAVGAGAIALDAVGSEHIEADAVGASEIASAAVGMAELEIPVDNAGNGTVEWILQDGDNYHVGNAASFTPAVDGKCLVVTTAAVLTTDGANTDRAFVQTIKVENIVAERDIIDPVDFPRIPDDSTGSVTVSAVWPVRAGIPTRFGCYVNVVDTQFEGDTLKCRTTYLCQ